MSLNPYIGNNSKKNWNIFLKINGVTLDDMRTIEKIIHSLVKKI